MLSQVKRADQLKVGDRVVWFDDDCEGASWDGYNHNKKGYVILDIKNVRQHLELRLETNDRIETCRFEPNDAVFKVLTYIKRNLPAWF